MPDMFAQGAAMISETRDAHLSQDVVYARGATTKAFRATPGRPETRREMPDSQVQFDTVRMDWTFRTTSLASLDLPERGDTILDGQNRMWRVGVDGIETCFVPCDPGYLDIRVQCVRIPA